MKGISHTFFIILFSVYSAFCQNPTINYIPAEVDFSSRIVDWDGFGFNYVEAAQTRNYYDNPQDYGGFSLLNNQQKEEILELVFGEDGLKIQIVKMFLDPYHQKSPYGPFDHELTTKNMMSFVKKGHQLTLNRDDHLEIITTLYGPPSWSTKQKFVGGRDLDPGQAENLCFYMADWVSFLQKHQLPVKYLSLHNEGEDFYRWDFEKGTQRLPGFDYNMYWPPKQVNQFLLQLPDIFEQKGIKDIKLTNGEPSNWTRFYHWNYAGTLFNDKRALDDLGLLTTTDL